MKYTDIHNHKRAQEATSIPWKRILFNPIVLTTWVVISSVITITLIRSMLEIRQNANLLGPAQDNLHQEEMKALDLSKQLKEADTPLSQEKIIRDQLGMQKPGETVLQLPTQH